MLQGGGRAWALTVLARKTARHAQTRKSTKATTGSALSAQIMYLLRHMHSFLEKHTRPAASVPRVQFAMALALSGQNLDGGSLPVSIISAKGVRRIHAPPREIAPIAGATTRRVERRASTTTLVAS